MEFFSNGMFVFRDAKSKRWGINDFYQVSYNDEVHHITAFMQKPRDDCCPWCPPSFFHGNCDIHLVLREKHLPRQNKKAMIAHSIENKFDDSHGNSCRLARGLSSQHSNGLAARARTGSWLGCVLPMAQHHSPQVKWLIASTNELDLPKLFFEGCDIGWLLTTLWVLGGAIWNQGWWHHVVFSY